MPCGSPKVPSPHDEMKLPSVFHIVSGRFPRLKTYTSSWEFTAASEARSKLQYLGMLGHTGTNSYLKSPEPTTAISYVVLPGECSAVIIYSVGGHARPLCNTHRGNSIDCGAQRSAAGSGPGDYRFDPRERDPPSAPLT